MSAQPTPKRPHGKLRRSQVITTFGPGAMLDLPHHSVLVAGLDTWTTTGYEHIREPRLVDKLKRILSVDHLELRTPPADVDDPSSAKTGIGAWQFPEWFITEVVRLPNQPPSERSRMLVHRKQLQGKLKFEYNAAKARKLSVVPIRFVRACRSGHIGDLGWRFFAHRGPTQCHQQLWIDEIGTSADLSELYVRCDCGKVDRRCMTDAADKDMHALGRCDGGQPWLGPKAREQCEEYNRLLIRTASNSYFPQLLSVISLPERDEALVRAVDHVWTHVQFVQSVDDLDHERKKKPVEESLKGFSDENVMEEIERRRGDSELSSKSVKHVEVEVLSSAREEMGEDKPDGTFHARALPRSIWDRPWMTGIERVVLVHRLREVVALAGFTRFEAVSPDVAGELDIDVKRAPLADEISWVPAIENRGEGVFIAFDRRAVEAWYSNPDVMRREESLKGGFAAWLAEHPTSKRTFPGIQYVMLHSFSHMLITAVSLECGYPASSIRERIFALPGAGYGVLLFTGTSDAEGTLGGLVEAGRRIHLHIRSALDMSGLCSNDPVCAEHEPKDDNERRFLHGAACHGCLLIAETSCEQHNDFLDRALVVPTVEDGGLEFFKLDSIG